MFVQQRSGTGFSISKLTAIFVNLFNEQEVAQSYVVVATRMPQTNSSTFVTASFKSVCVPSFILTIGLISPLPLPTSCIDSELSTKSINWKCNLLYMALSCTVCECEGSRLTSGSTFSLDRSATLSKSPSHSDLLNFASSLCRGMNLMAELIGIEYMR